MSDIIDIVIQETIDLVDITVNPNIIEVNVTRTSGGGGSQTLAQTLALGNTTGGENIVINDADAIELENGSSLKKGTYDFGGDGGISRICSVDYEDMWQAGIRHVFDNNGFIRHSTNCFDVVPDSSFDNTLRFKIDSLWTLDNGTTYKCTDASTGAAVWELYDVGGIPTLQEVTDEGNTTTNSIIIQGVGAASAKQSIYAQGAFELNDINGENGYIAGVADSTNNEVGFRFNVLNTINSDILLKLADGYFTQAFPNTNNLWFNIPYKPEGIYTLATLDDITSSGTVTSVGLTMPSAFTVTNSPITSSGNIAVTGAGAVSQYIRGDGTLANFPTSSGGGSSLSFYLNGSVSQGTIGGVAFREMDRTPILGAGTDFTINANGYIQSFITDAGVPNLLEIPAGNWNFETYFSASSGGGSPSFYVELYKWNGTTLSLIASSSATPEAITGGTSIDLYVSALAVPQTTLLATDRLAVRIYVTHSGRTITLHTEDNHLCQVITTFSTGLTALNGLTAQVQNLATGTSGTDFGIVSSGSTHTFNLPNASAANRGLLTSADWTTFNNKLNTASPSFTGILSGVGTTLTGTAATSLADLIQTWNTTGAPTAIKLNVTNTASSASSLLIDLQTNGASRFRVNATGLITAGGLSMSGADATARYFGAQNGLPNGYNSAFQGFGTAFAHTSGEKSTFVDELSWSPSSGSGSKSSYTFSGTINQTGTATGITRGIYINPTLTSAVDFRAIDVVAGKLMFSSTIIPSGTTGAATINKISGKVNAAAGSTSLVVTNSLVTTSSIVMCQIGTNDATCVIKSVVEANGSFTINFIAPTAETVIKFKVIN